MNAQRTALVTGGSGFLGSHVVRGLRRNGWRLHLVVRPASDLRRLGDVDGLTVSRGELTDRTWLARTCAEAAPDAILHLAGSYAARRFDGRWDQVRDAQRANVGTFVDLLEAAAVAGPQLRMLVRLGGLEEYGSGPAPFVEIQREAPRSPYSASQVAATHLAQALQPYLAFALVTLRPTLIYGPGQSSDFLLPALISALLAGRRFALSGGNQRRDLLHVDDFVTATAAVLDGSDLNGAVLNIASGEARPIREIATDVARLIGAEHLLDIGAAQGRAQEIMDLRGDANEAMRRLGWHPKVSLDEGLRAVVGWHRRMLAAEARG